MTASHQKTHSLVRLETFTDAVFAVAMTVLVLDLKTPEISATVRENRFNFGFLVRDLPHLLAFLVSFLWLGIDWLVLVNFFRGVTRATWGMMWMTLLHLMFVCIVPWSTAFVASHPFLPQAAALYSIVLTCAGVPSYWLSRYLDREFPVPDPRSFRIDSAMILLGIVATIAAFVTVYLPIAIFVLSTTLYFTPKRIRRRVFRSAKPTTSQAAGFAATDYSI